MFIELFIYSFISKYVLSIDCMRGINLGFWNIVVNEIKLLRFWNLNIRGER